MRMVGWMCMSMGAHPVYGGGMWADVNVDGRTPLCPVALVWRALTSPLPSSDPSTITTQESMSWTTRALLFFRWCLLLFDQV